MSNLQEELLKEKAEARRPWRWMVGIFSVLFLVLGVLVFSDAPAPDDAWMLPEFTPGGGPENDLAIFLDAAKRQARTRLKLPAPEVKNVDIDKIEEAREYLAENSELLNLYDGLIKTDHSAARNWLRTKFCGKCCELALPAPWASPCTPRE